MAPTAIPSRRTGLLRTHPPPFSGAFLDADKSGFGPSRPSLGVRDFCSIPGAPHLLKQGAWTTTARKRPSLNLPAAPHWPLFDRLVCLLASCSFVLSPSSRAYLPCSTQGRQWRSMFPLHPICQGSCRWSRPGKGTRPHACDTEAQTCVGLGESVRTYCCDVGEPTLAVVMARTAQLVVHDHCFPCGLGSSLSSHELSSCQASTRPSYFNSSFRLFCFPSSISLSLFCSVHLAVPVLLPHSDHWQPGLPGCASTPTYFYVLLS